MKKFLIALLAVTLLGGCASDDPETDALPSPAGEDITTTDAPTETDAPIQAGGDCQQSPADQQADLEMQDFVFAPTCLEVRSGQGLRLHNEGDVKHNWSLETGLDVDVEPGQENNTEGTGLEPGTYEFFCKYHRESHEMEGELQVKSG